MRVHKIFRSSNLIGNMLETKYWRGSESHNVYHIKRSIERKKEETQKKRELEKSQHQYLNTIEQGKSG